MASEVKNEEWRGKVGKMSEEEFAAFLAGNPFCRIGCVDEEGWPYVVPCWFEYRDGGFYIIPRAKSAWACYIQRDRRVFLCIDDTTIYNVVVNHEEQYSIWAADRENPLGWNNAGKQGTKQDCLAYIEEVWTDMRPLSLRKKMEEGLT